MDKAPSRDDLVELVRKIIACEGSETELDEMMDLFKASVPHPEPTDLIYWADKELTPEEIVDAALAHVPLVTPPPTDVGP